jgi:N-acetylmuramoyl-L-alanine amidase
MKIVISSGHGKYVRGASGYLDEVDEARKVVNKVAAYLNEAGVKTEVFHDDVSHSQNENLNRIVSFHNSETRDLDVSVHFNAYETTGAPMGTECLYVTQATLAETVAAKIARVSGLKNRGPKKRTDLFFLNKTNEPAILIEVCFVDSTADAGLYNEGFTAICIAIAEAVGGVEIGFDEIPAEPPVIAPPGGELFYVKGRASYFGGPDDEGVSPSEGLAFIFAVEDAPQLFLPFQPEGTTGLARRLNPYVHYVACRWDYAQTPKSMLVEKVALVRAQKTGIALKAFAADWGPNQNTGRVADLSPSLMEDLGIKTDDQVEVTFPQKLAIAQNRT